MSEASIAGVILAAGSSTRMGRNKLLLDVGGETMLRRSARQALEAGLAPVVVVLGHQAERVREELAHLACVPVYNPEHGRGPGASLRIGVNSVREAAGVVLLLADMPFVTTAMLAALVARYRDGGTRLVMSRYGDVEAPPHLFDQSLFDELLSGPDERCAKQVIRRHMKEAAVMSWPAAALQDVDQETDYERIRAQFPTPTSGHG